MIQATLLRVASAGLIAAACTSAPSAQSIAEIGAVDHAAHAAQHDLPTLTVNVYVTDRGFEPASFSIPVGREIELVLRNVGAAEHHFKVAGLVPGRLLRLAPDDLTIPAAAGDEHDHHGGGSLAPLGASMSPAGVTRSGKEVHAYARAGGMDVIVFTAAKTGTFRIGDPLHPGLAGTLTVL